MCYYTHRKTKHSTISGRIINIRHQGIHKTTDTNKLIHTQTNTKQTDIYETTKMRNITDISRK